MILRIITQTFKDTGEETGYGFRSKIQKRFLLFWWKNETEYKFTTDWDAQEYILTQYQWDTIDEIGANHFKLK